MAALLARPCRCGACRRCQENQRFEDIFRKNYAREEALYYAPERSLTGSSFAALREARCYPFGRPRARRVRRKEPS
jgi:hypothetical protein